MLWWWLFAFAVDHNSFDGNYICHLDPDYRSLRKHRGGIDPSESDCHASAPPVSVHRGRDHRGHSSITIYITSAKSSLIVSEEALASISILMNRPGGGSCGCSYTEKCNTQFVSTDGHVYTTNNDAFSACSNLWSNSFNCLVHVYQKTEAPARILRSYNTVANRIMSMGLSHLVLAVGCVLGVISGIWRDIGRENDCRTRARGGTAPVGGMNLLVP